MNSEHVEVLRELRDTGDVSDWRAMESALDAAIAALSAPQPPAEAQRCTCPSGDGSLRWPCPAHPPEAQPVAWEWEYVGVAHYPRGHKVARSLREMDPTNPPYPDTWRPTRPLIYGDTAPPSAPVGVEAILEAFDEISGLCRHLRQGGPAPEDLQDLSDALDEAVGIAANMLHDLAQQPASTLPDVDDDDLTVAYMAGRHDGRKEAQQPAAVDEAMSPQVAREWLLELMDDYDFTMPSDALSEIIVALTYPAQPGGSDNGR